MADSYLFMPSKWHQTTLEPDKNGDFIVSVDSGGTPSTINEDYWDGDIPWITPKDITSLTDTIYVYGTQRNITDQGLKNSGAKLLKPNTVLLTKRAPVGIVVVNAVSMATNQGFLNFRCGLKLLPLYLAYWLKVNRRYLEMIANGSTYPELYKGDLFEFKMAVPPLAKQESILEVIKAIHHIKLLSTLSKKSLLLVDYGVISTNGMKDFDDIELSIIKGLMSGKIDVSKVKTK